MNVVDEEPFGELWEKEMSKWAKKDLILFLKHNLIDLQDTKQKLQQHVMQASGSDVSEGAAGLLIVAIKGYTN